MKMIEKMGVSDYGLTFWKMVPNLPGTGCELEVGIVASKEGLQVGAGMITWADLDQARAKFTDG